MKKALSIFLAVILVVGMIPLTTFSIFAADELPTKVTLSDDATKATYTDLNNAIAAVADGGTIEIVGTYTYVKNYAWTAHKKTVTITGNGTGIIEAPKGDMNIRDSVTFTALTLNNHGGSIYANGNPLTINGDVNIPEKVNIISGGNTSGEVINGNTSLELYAGSYTYIMGGSYGGKVNGNTHVTIGGSVNSLYAKDDINGNGSAANVYGGGYGKGNSPVEVTGNSSVTVTGNARANNVVGGVMTPGTVHCDSYVNMDGGDVYRIIGGGRGANANNTFVNVTGGNVRYVFGGCYNATVTGNTTVYVGGTTNTTASDILGECVVSDHDHQNFRIFGGGFSEDTGPKNSVVGNTYVTVEGNVKANGVYGGGDKHSTGVGGTAYVNILGGSFMTVYGGGYNSPVANTVVNFVDGTAEQIFGGSESAAVSGNTLLRVLGGKITRRVYGGSYNNHDGSDWTSKFGVAGTSTVVISDKSTIDFSYSDGFVTTDKSIYAGSRHANNVDGNEVLAFLDATAKTKYSGKLGAQDLIMKGYMNGKPVADEIHTLSHTANGSVITESCTDANCDHSATASLIIDGSCGYKFGEPVTPAKIVYSEGWLGEELGAITYENNTAMVGETATAKATLARAGATATLAFEIAPNRIEVYNTARGENTVAFKDLLGKKLLEHTTYVLMEKIDLGGAKLAPAQRISLANGTTIDGQGNSITGFDLSVGNSSALFDATDKVGTDEGKAMVMTIKDVVFGSESDPVAFPHDGGEHNGCVGFAIVKEVGANDTLTLSGLTSYVESTGSGKVWQFYSAILGINNGKVSIDNCNTYGNLGAHGYNGGFIGWNNSDKTVEIKNSENNVSVTGTLSRYYAGFIGLSDNANSNVTIRNCVNNGAISGEGYAGGFVSETKGTLTIIDCINTANVSATRNGELCVGGIVGKLTSGTLNVSGSKNSGKIVGSNNTANGNNVGGILGLMASGTTVVIDNCENTGSVVGNSTAQNDAIGGIVGNVAGGTETITNCTNKGNVYGARTAGTKCGGIVGVMENINAGSKIENCHNKGLIGVNSDDTSTATAIYSGGIVAFTRANANVSYCTNSGEVKGYQMAGGIIASPNAAITVTHCTNKGNVSYTRADATNRFWDGAGGIIAYSDGKDVIIEDCSNSGAISGIYAGGAISGINSTANLTITRFANTASVTGNTRVGGVQFIRWNCVDNRYL